MSWLSSAFKHAIKTQNKQIAKFAQSGPGKFLEKTGSRQGALNPAYMAMKTGQSAAAALNDPRFFSSPAKQAQVVREMHIQNQAAGLGPLSTAGSGIRTKAQQVEQARQMAASSDPNVSAQGREMQRKLGTYTQQRTVGEIASIYGAAEAVGAVGGAAAGGTGANAGAGAGATGSEAGLGELGGGGTYGGVGATASAASPASSSLLSWGNAGNAIEAGGAVYSAVAGEKQAGAAKRAAAASDPWAAYRPGFAQQLAALSMDPSSITGTPGYKEGLEFGETALERQLAAGGQLGSGAEKIAMQNLGQTYASNVLGGEQTRLANLAGGGFGPMAFEGQTAYMNAINQALASMGYGARSLAGA